VVELGSEQLGPELAEHLDVATGPSPLDTNRWLPTRLASRNNPSEPSCAITANAVSSAELTNVTSEPITSLIVRARNG